MTIYEGLSLLVPIFAAIIVGILTYRFAIRSKKLDLLYASKIPAFKEIVSKLATYNAFCMGRVAYFQANELSPFYSENLEALFHRTEIANVTNLNAVFLSKSNREAITLLLNEMSILCDIELNIANKHVDDDYTHPYQQAALKAEALIHLLYNDLNLSD